MSSFYSTGTITWLSSSTIGTTYAVTGLGFTPKALKFYAMGLNSAVNTFSITTDIRYGIGFATSTSDRRCVGSKEVDAAATTVCTSIYRNDAVFALCKETGPAADGLLDLQSLDADGFTLIVDAQAGVSVTVAWEAWGGTDITVATTLEISEPAATGNQSYTVTGFSSTDSLDQVVMFSATQLTSANTVARSNINRVFGATTGTAAGENILCAVAAEDGTSTGSGSRWGGKTYCAGVMGFSGPGLLAAAKLNAFIADGFQLNWVLRNLTNRKYIALAIKGGKWVAGRLDLDIGTTNATTTVTGLGFQPGGFSFATVFGAENVPNGGNFVPIIGLGSASSLTNRQGMECELIESAPDDDLRLSIAYDAVLPYTGGSSINVLVDLSAIGSDGFTLKTDLGTGSSSTASFEYLVFEATTPGASSSANAAYLHRYRKNILGA